MPKNWFNLSVGIILVITSIGKILSALGHAAILQRIDPIFAIKFNHLMLLAGGLELLVAFICFSKNHRVLGQWATAWLATCFLIYRLGLWWIGWHRPCHCLGSFADALHISEKTADAVMKIVLAYLLIGSYTMLLHSLWSLKKESCKSINDVLSQAG